MLDVAPAPFVRISRVSKTFPTGSVLNRTYVRAVVDANLEIAAGHTLGLVGESGSGKSTLGQIVVGLLSADEGAIEIGGRDIAKEGKRGLQHHWRNTQMVFQDPYSSLNPRLTVRETLQEPLLNFGIARGADAERLIRQTLDACGLPASASDRYPRAFSGGQRQRVGIARALIVRPKLIIADEPVSALDLSIQAQIVNLMQDLKSEFGLTYLFIAHDLAVVRHVSDRIAVMYRGAMVEVGAVDDVYGTPQHPYTRLLLGSVPIPDVQLEQRRLREMRAMRSAERDGSASGCPFASRCPVAIERCFSQAPALAKTATGQLAACHLAPNAAGDQPRRLGNPRTKA